MGLVCGTLMMAVGIGMLMAVWFVRFTESRGAR